eukprot:scaffold218321_cov28-Tisochrysis_lutea.AAC.1
MALSGAGALRRLPAVACFLSRIECWALARTSHSKLRREGEGQGREGELALIRTRQGPSDKLGLTRKKLAKRNDSQARPAGVALALGAFTTQPARRVRAKRPKSRAICMGCASWRQQVGQAPARAGGQDGATAPHTTPQGALEFASVRMSVERKAASAAVAVVAAAEAAVSSGGTSWLSVVEMSSVTSAWSVMMSYSCSAWWIAGWRPEAPKSASPLPTR